MTQRAALLISVALCAGSSAGAQEPGARFAGSAPEAFSSASRILEQFKPGEFAQVPTDAEAQTEPAPPFVSPEVIARGASSIVIFGAVSLIPVALLVLTAFVRISIVLLLVRQALGSMQVPGNQVITALSLMLTGVVMAPVAERVYRDAIAPYAEGRKEASAAWRDGTTPIKEFMGKQIIKTKHHNYLWTFYRHASGSAETANEPATIEEFPLRAVAPAFLVSELTTALYMGFAIFLPFLVVDLVVSVLLSTMGLFLMPPALVAVPIKLALFVLADGWMLVSDVLVRSFA